MKIKEILEHKLPANKKLNKNKSRRGEDLSFSDIEKLMRHDCYKRVKGAVRRVR